MISCGRLNKLSFENCLVTGGCGFIGSHIVDSPIEHSAEKVTVVSFSSPGWKNVTSIDIRITDAQDTDI